MTTLNIYGNYKLGLKFQNILVHILLFAIEILNKKERTIKTKRLFKSTPDNNNQNYMSYIKSHLYIYNCHVHIFPSENCLGKITKI